MKVFAGFALASALMLTLSAFAATDAPVSPMPPGERLGSVAFPVSCSPAVQAQFDRGVALLHDFWYAEARPQFERIAMQDPACAMAHWGIAMSVFHQIWDRPDDATMARGWREMRAAQFRPAATAREREYVAALADFYRPGSSPYEARIAAYSAAMGTLFRHYPRDVDAGAFYALSLLASEAPDDTGLTHERAAMTVLNPLFKAHPDHPGVVHYIIHACDTPALAADGLAAARHYGQIAASGPHAVHMPGHIFARLGMWQEDIDANVGSVAASRAAEARHQSGAMDQFHSDDFLLYAYLQSAQDDRAADLLKESSGTLDHVEHMPTMTQDSRSGMFAYYQTEYPVIYALEMRDWTSAAALEPVAAAPPEVQTLTYWARAIAYGHLRQPQQARAAVAAFDALMERVRTGPRAYLAAATGSRIERGEMLAWSAFAAGDAAQSLQTMRVSADLQDKVGQGEVDIPAREMLGDMLLESARPREAVAEYRRALALSPNRFNGLYHAGLAAEKAGDTAQAAGYYAALLKSTDNGSRSARPELDHAKAMVAAAKLAAD